MSPTWYDVSDETMVSKFSNQHEILKRAWGRGRGGGEEILLVFVFAWKDCIA